MRIVHIKAGEDPVIKEVDDSLETFQKLVGGYIEPVRLKNNIDLWLNDEGKILNLKPNIILYKDGKQVDFVVGDAFFAGEANEGETVGLTDEQIRHISDNLHEGTAITRNDDGTKQIQKVYRFDVD